jgi:hypothetical protein
MPLIKSGSKKARNANIKTLVGEVGSSPHVKSVKQAVAIAYSEQRRHGGGRKSKLDHHKVSKWTHGERKDYK